MDRRVEEAIARLRPLAHAERAQAASGVWEAIAVLTLMAPPLPDEVKMVGSVAHMPVKRAFVVLQGVTEERGFEATNGLRAWFKDVVHSDVPAPCGRLCVLINQGPCRCVVPQAVAELRRRQRALLWACEAIMRPAREEPIKAVPRIMVDELVAWPHTPKDPQAARIFGNGKESCHLSIEGDDLEPLHALAKKIGMKREWFQPHRLMPHYDLTPKCRDATLKAGAVFVPAREQAIARRKARGAPTPDK